MMKLALLDAGSLEIVAWLFLVSLACLLGIYVLILLMRNKAQSEMKVARSLLRKRQAESQQIRVSARNYVPTDPEPYGRVVSELNRQLNKIDGIIGECHNRYGQLQSKIRTLGPHNLKAILRMPLEWHAAWKQSTDLVTVLENLAEDLTTARYLSERLMRLAWEIALQLRLTLKNVQAALGILEELRSQGIHDPVLNDSVARGSEWEKALSSNIPIYMLAGEEKEILTQADKDSVIQIYQTLSKARPGTDRLLTKAKEWKNQVKQLEQAKVELANSLEECTKEMQVLEAHPVRPLVWEQSRQDVIQLAQKTEAVISHEETYTLGLVKKDLDKAQGLIAAVRELAGQCRLVEQGHSELLALFGSPEIQDGLDWARGAQKLAKQTAAYDSENWPKGDGVIKLNGEVQTLSDIQQRLIVSARSTKGELTPIRESELENTLRETRQLVLLHQSLRPRVARVQARLAEIQTMEREAKEDLSRSKALLNQTEMILTTNPLLAKTSLTEIKQMRENMEKLSKQLGQPERGVVEGKAQKAHVLVTSAQKGCNQWLEQLKTDLEVKKDLLTEKISKLNSIAPLDDPAIIEALPFIQPPDKPTPSAEKPQAKGGLPLSEAVMELKKKNEEWQRCAGLLKAIEAVEGPVVDSYEKAKEQRQKAREGLSRALELIPESRAWPPAMQTMAGERGELDKIERDWANLTKEPIAPIRLVSRLGDLSGSYQELAARISQKVERAGQEQNRIRELENRLAESSRLWQYQMQLNADNILARDDILALLDETDKEHEGIKERFRRGGISYNQSLQHLRMLCQKLDSTLIRLDDRRYLDINGEIEEH